jgi:hypothetical protein
VESGSESFVLDLGYLAGTILVASCALLDHNMVKSRVIEGREGEEEGEGEREGEGEGGMGERGMGGGEVEGEVEIGLELEGITSEQQCFTLLSEVNALTLLWHEDTAMPISLSLSLSIDPYFTSASTPPSLPSANMRDRVLTAAHEALRGVYTFCESGEREDAEDFGFSITERKALCPERGIIFFCDGSGRETLIRTMCEAMLRCCRVERKRSSGGSRLVSLSSSITASGVIASNSMKSAANNLHPLTSSTLSVAQNSLESEVQVLRHSTTFAFKVLLLAILSLHEKEVEKKEKKQTEKEEEIRFKTERKTSAVIDRKEIKKGGSDGCGGIDHIGVDSVIHSAHPHSGISCSSGDVKVKCVDGVLSIDMKQHEERVGEGNEEGESKRAHTASADRAPIPKKIPKRRMIQVVIVADDGDGDGVEDDTDQNDGPEGGGKPKKRKRKAVMYVVLSPPLRLFFSCSARWLLSLCTAPFVSFSLTFFASTLVSTFIIVTVR